MGEFTSDHFHQSLIKPSFSFFDHVFDDDHQDITQYSANITPNSNTITITNNGNNNNVMDNSALANFQAFLPFSSDNFFSNPTSELVISPNLLPQTQNLQGYDANSNCASLIKPVVIDKIVNYEYSNNESNKKRKSVLVNSFDGSESSSGISSPVSQTGVSIVKTRNNGSGKGKRVKNNNNNNKEELEKPKDVVHVRARRGQATDSHSLAERVRRGKINERLKCLQDIVPGCYKTMGMAVMLDEIINYVQSLQNQVEFLSMKLTAASTFYDFNSETDAVEKLQRAKANEAKEIERLIREGYGGFSCFHSNWPL